jgi:hypothetical protein
MFDASHQACEDVGDGPGQGPRGTRGREAAMGVTIFSGLPGKMVGPRRP